MSPAPQANLQVEKYIGSYLISQRHPPGNVRYPAQHVNKYGYHHGAGWAGMPLISTAQRRNKKVDTTKPAPAKGQEAEDGRAGDKNRSPLTRLAIHTQGAPLIQAGRYNSNRTRNNYREPPSRGHRGESRWEAKPTPVSHHKEQAGGNTDSLSVASDEGSANSENSLPRIIKPRKRRKKDRKPVASTNAVSPTPSDQSPETATFLAGSDDTRPPASERKTTLEDKLIEDLIDPLSSADDLPLGKLLEAACDDRTEVSPCIPASLCQCRYCDPSGVIWNVDQRCYSPFLTPPWSWATPSAEGLQVSSEIVTSPNGHRDIEIKFYSCPSPSESSKEKSSERSVANEE